MGDLEPLREIFEGNSDTSSPRHLTDVDRQVLNQVKYAAQNKWIHYISYD